MTRQMIRPSQFILVYGPGAILEGRRGPRIIPGLREGLLRGDVNPEDFEISDGGMLKAALDGKRIFKMPSKEMMKTEGVERPYRTAPFPRWRMCVNTSGHEGAYLLYYDRNPQGGPCPACGVGNPGATRFVRACPDGHMDEVDWYRLVHRGDECGGTARSGLPRALSGNDDTFYYRSGGPISSVVLECPRCGAKEGLGTAYGRPWPCSGRNPESEPPGSGKARRPGCSKNSRIIHRQASNLRMPVVETHFTTGPHVTGVHVCMKGGAVRAALFAPGRDPPGTREDALKTFEWLHEQGQLSADQMYDIRRSSWEVLKDAIDGARKKPEGGFGDMISGEFRGLLDAAENGAPPEGRSDSGQALFEVERNSTRGTILLGRELRVTPVRRLRTITAQTGFRRMIASGEAAGGPRSDGDGPEEAEEVDIGFDRNGHRWYPGVEFLGEGLFITAGNDVVRDSKAAREWRRTAKDGYSPHVSQHGLFRELDPAFVWWHTLAHALTRAVGEHAGYSSTSIRERVYVEGRRGGILLYATQPGNDGTLGGLISLAPHMDRILPAAMEEVLVCSGDPLCRRQEFKPGDLNGAACYGCLMNSETSCEHRNMWLDRHVLLDDPQ